MSKECLMILGLTGVHGLENITKDALHLEPGLSNHAHERSPRPTPRPGFLSFSMRCERRTHIAYEML